MTYKEAIEYLYSRLPMFSRIGAAAYKPGLNTCIELDNFFGNPHTKFKSIHVGGTNGKGSTSHLLASVLQAQGYKVGLYTSPHLVDFRERIRINGEMIPEEIVIRFVEEYQKSNYAGSPSFFELTMIMAFSYFAEMEVDYAVIEVGMGGRLDSTNILQPEACIITNISKDHTQFLGDTLEKIAFEKAGIIKKGVPVVIGEAEGDVKKVFADRAENVQTEITFACEQPEITDSDRTSFGWNLLTKNFGKIESSLSGDYQLKNFNTALTAIKSLRRAGIEISKESVARGFKNVEETTGLKGRWTQLSQEPLVICDTGHNEAGLRYNLTQLESIREHTGGRLLFVIGFVADKAIDDILKLFPKGAKYFITNASIPRALPVSELEKKFKDFGFDYESFSTVAEAYSYAKKEASGNDIIYVGGSTFIVADLLSEKENLQ